MIHTNVRIRVLIDTQSATGMLAEYVDDASHRQLGQLTQNLAGYQVKAARLVSKCNLYLLYHRSF